MRPLRLHTQEVEHGGLGGHCFSADFARYLAKVKPRLVVVRDAQVRYWWASAYGRQRVERRFTQRFGADKGKIAYRAALVVGSGFWGADAYERITTETGHGVTWIAWMGRLASQYAGARA